MGDKDYKRDILNKRISLSSKVGVTVSLALLIIGLIIVGISGYKNSEPLVLIRQLPHAILNMDPSTITTLAVLILLITPVSQIIIALVTFLSEKDRTYSGICLIILCILTVSIVISLISN